MQELPSHLTPQGQDAMQRGAFADLISADKRDCYRNPPAHTRFLPLSVAKEGKAYVDESLQQMFDWLVAYRSVPRLEVTVSCRHPHCCS